MRHFLNLFDVTPQQINKLLERALRLKKAHKQGKHKPVLKGRVVALIFEKPSLRTRVSFEAAVAQLGGTSIFLSGNEVGLGVRESIPDFARTVSRYVDGVVLRTFSHNTIEQFAEHANCPVINGLSDCFHPCQALADLLTIKELFDDLDGRTVAFIGDGNNVARSLALGCGKLGVRFILAGPDGYGFDDRFLTMYHQSISNNILVNGDLSKAVSSADIIYTDVWTSMGQEQERDQRLKQFSSYQVNAELMALAPKHARLMHCLPAHRGEEVTADVIDSDRSVVFEQAENRMHAQKALLQWLLH